MCHGYEKGDERCCTKGYANKDYEYRNDAQGEHEGNQKRTFPISSKYRVNCALQRKKQLVGKIGIDSQREEANPFIGDYLSEFFGNLGSGVWEKNHEP